VPGGIGHGSRKQRRFRRWLLRRHALRRDATGGSITGVKLSVSVPSDDVAFLDAYAAEHALGSRSAALHDAIRALRVSALPGSYAEAWSDWSADGDAEAWEATVGDDAP
jgi:hypothetical protein